MAFIKFLNSADAGTSSLVGGIDWDTLDKYHDNIDITPKVGKVNTRTYTRSGKRELRNPGDTFSYVETASAITADRIVTYPVLAGNDTLVFEAHAQTLSNKTISGSSNTITNIGTSAISNDAITYAKIQNVTDNRLLGRSAGSAGDVQEISIGSGLSLSSGVLSATGGGGGAPVGAGYVTTALDATLTAERVITAGDGMSMVDGGAGGNLTLSTKSRVLARDVTESSISNTTTETDVFSFNVPANLLGTNKAIRVRVYGTQLNNSGSDKTWTIKIKYGATTMYESVGPTVTTSNITAILNFEVVLIALNATNSQYCSIEQLWGSRDTPTTGVGKLSSGGGKYYGSGTASEDSTIAKDFKMTFQHSAAHASNTFTITAVFIELID